MQEVILAVDAGTSSLKIVAFDYEGREVASAIKGYPTHFPASSKVEQSPHDWWEALVSCLHLLWEKGVAPKNIVAIVLSGQMELCLPLDKDFNPLCPAILCSDMRAQEEISFITENVGRERFWSYTGNFPRASMTVAKILWLKKHLSEVYRATKNVINSSKDYLLLRLTGVNVTDPTSASTTGMLNIRKRTWEEDILQNLNIPCSLLPPVVASTEKVGVVNFEIARITGLPAGCPVFNGLGDAGASNLGAGVFDPSRAHCYLGTTGWVATVDTLFPSKPREGLFMLCDSNPRYYILVAPLLNAGRAYRWAIETLGCEGEDYLRLEKVLEEVPPGSKGVLFLPYLQGERSPFFDPYARGVFFGLSETTTKAEMLRAVLEGVSFAIRQVMNLLKAEKAHQELSLLTLIGGGSRSQVWAQILADVCGMEIVVPERGINATCLGAFLLALSGCHDFLNQSVFDVILGGSQLYKPSQKAQIVYDKLFPIFERLYPLLREVFAERAKINFD